MHVNNIQSQPLLDLNLVRQPEVQSQGKWGNGHSVTLIRSDTNFNSSTFKLKDAAQGQFQQIDQQASLSSSKTLAKPTYKLPTLNYSRDKQIEVLGDFDNLLQENGNKCLFLLSKQNGKNVAKNVNHEDLRNAPLPEGSRLIAAFEREGIMVVPGRENSDLEIDEIHDENGQVREFQFLTLDDDLYSQFQEKVDVHVNNFIEMKKAENPEKSKHHDELDNVRSTLSEKVTKIKNQVIEIETTVRKPASKNVQELAEKVDLFFPTIHSIIIKNVEAEKAKEKEEIELERKNLDKKFTIIQQDVKLFDLFQERVKTGQKFEAISLSEQNHLRANRFKPIEHAKTPA